MSTADGQIVTPKRTAFRPNPHQRLVVDLMCKPPFPSMFGAARQLAVPENTARDWTRNPRFRDWRDSAVDAAVAEFSREMGNTLTALVPSAIQATQKNLVSEDGHVRHKAASYLIDRTLGKAEDRLDVTSAGERIVTIAIDQGNQVADADFSQDEA